MNGYLQESNKFNLEKFFKKQNISTREFKAHGRCHISEFPQNWGLAYLFSKLSKIGGTHTYLIP